MQDEITTEKTTLRVLGYDLTGKGRPDGSIYYTCGALPGFHYILEPGHAGISLTLAPALSRFLRFNGSIAPSSFLSSK